MANLGARWRMGKWGVTSGIRGSLRVPGHSRRERGAALLGEVAAHQQGKEGIPSAQMETERGEDGAAGGAVHPGAGEESGGAERPVSAPEAGTHDGGAVVSKRARDSERQAPRRVHEAAGAGAILGAPGRGGKGWPRGPFWPPSNPCPLGGAERTLCPGEGLDDPNPPLALLI